MNPIKRIITIAAITIALFLSACGASVDTGGDKLDSDAVATDVKASFEEQLSGEEGGDAYKVQDMDCVVATPTTGRCFAKVNSVDGTMTVGIDLTIDADTGEYIWEVTSQR